MESHTNESPETQPPEEAQSSNLPVPARNFTTHELEAVIRRAVELQAGRSARTEEGVSAAELVRIGQELSLDPGVMRRAMAEVRGGAADETGPLVAAAGPRVVSASRMLRRPAADTARMLDEYLRQRELMIAQRRFPDRTRYVRDSSMAAGFTRFTRGFARGHQPLDVQQLDVAVAAIDEDSCLLTVSVDLGGTRGGLVAGVLGSSAALAGGWALITWVTAIADPFMLLGLPAIAGSWWGTRAIYSTIRHSMHDKLESLLDRVEHNELS